MTPTISHIKDLLSKKLNEYSWKHDEGDAEFSSPAERIIEVSENDGGFLVKIASDQLSLDDKIDVESYLVSGLDESIKLTIYFKRTRSRGPSSQVGGPKPISGGSKTGPFGFPIQKKAIPGVSRVIAVSSGKGGVGKSTISTNLAVSLAKSGKKVGLLDADIYGPSAPLMLGLEGPMPVAGGNRIVPIEGHGVKCVSFGFMSDAKNPVIWRGPMVTKALKQLFYETDWGELDYLVLDLPPGTGDVQMTMIEQLPIHGGIIVSTPQSVALLDAHKGLTMFQKMQVPVLGVVENMSFYSCSKCGHQESIFGEEMEQFAEERDLPIISRIPLQIKIRQGADLGRPVALGSDDISKHYDDLAGLVVEKLIQ